MKPFLIVVVAAILGAFAGTHFGCRDASAPAVTARSQQP